MLYTLQELIRRKPSKTLNIRHKTAVVSAIILFLYHSSFAQRVFTLRECVETAWQNNIEIRQTALNVDAARSDLQQSFANRIPNVNASGSHQYNYGRSINPFDNAIVENKLVQSNSFGLAVGLNLYNGFQNNYTIERNKLNLMARGLDLEENKNNLALNTIDAFLNLTLQKETLKAAKLQLESTKSQLENTSKLVKSGALPLVNELELQGQLATEELNIVNIENALAQAKLNLLQLMQLPANTDFDIQPPDIVQAMLVLPSQTPQSIFETALSSQPQIRAGETRIIAADKNVQIAKSSFSPNINLNGGIFTNYSNIAQKVTPGKPLATPIFTPTPLVVNQDPTQVVYQVTASTPPEISNFKYFEQLNNNLRRGLTLQMNIPIFNHLQVRNAVTNAEIGKKSAQLQLEATKNRLRQVIEQAFISAKASEKRYQSLERQIKALSETFRITELRYEQGLVNANDYLIAKNNLNRAENEILRTKYDLILRIKVLDFYLGKPLEL
jgi:outer membrane protein